MKQEETRYRRNYGESSFVYLARCGDVYKIGSSQNPQQRINDLQTANPQPVELVGFVPATPDQESLWHATFRHKRVRGEWFALDDGDVARILKPRRLTPSEMDRADFDQREAGKHTPGKDAIVGWKMVRDWQQQWAHRHGVSGQWRVAADPAAALRRKLMEEVIEFLEHGELGELCDVEDVIAALWSIADPETVRVARVLHEEKTRCLGKFSEHVEWSPVPAEHEREAW